MLKYKASQIWYWVSPSFWEIYLHKFGGPEGKYGYPTSQQVPLNDGLRQYFQHGWLFYQAGIGVLTNAQYSLYKEGKLHCSPTPVSGTPTAPPTGLRVANVYQVDSAGGVPYQLQPNDYASQPFKSPLSYVDKIGVIVGLDPRSNHGGTHGLKIELVGTGGRVLGKMVALLANNVYTTVPLPDVKIRRGRTYYIRVYNYSLDTLGVYLNDPKRTGELSTNDGMASVNGTQEPGVLSAYVEARTEPARTSPTARPTPTTSAAC
jgi:hypothetical protein